MTDVFSQKTRSLIMSRVKGSGNRATESTLVLLLRRNHISGWRRNRRLFGKPDFVFPKIRLAVFVDGCFWHNCPTHGEVPATNTKFWGRKLTKNKARDLKVTKSLASRGWCVVRIWQHELSVRNEAKLVSRLKHRIEARSRVLRTKSRH